MSTTKDTQISIRLSSELLERIDAAAKALSDQIGYPVSRNTFIERTLEIRARQIEEGANPNAIVGDPPGGYNALLRDDE